MRILAEGEATKIRLIAEAEAERAARVGIAQAMAIEEQVRAYGGPQFQLTQQVMDRFAEAIETSHVDVVPKIQMSSDGKGGGSLVENLLALLLSGKLGETVGINPTAATAAWTRAPRPCVRSSAAACRAAARERPRRRGTGRPERRRERLLA